LSRKTNCPATLNIEVNIEDASQTYKCGPKEHTCQDRELKVGPDFVFVDEREAMKARVEELVLADPSSGAKQLSHQVMQEFLKKNKGSAFEFVSVDQMAQQGIFFFQAILPTLTLFLCPVYNFKSTAFGNCDSVLKASKLYYCADDDKRPFLQFHFGFVQSEKGWVELLGWGHPSLIFLLKSGEHHIFVDCTFYDCPKGYYQCLIFMIYEEATALYIPVFYVLLPSKHQVPVHFLLTYLKL
jgi:hypothetical protein